MNKNLFLIFLTLVICCGCKDFQRFSYEKYTCINNKFNLNEVYLPNTTISSNAIVNIQNKEYEATISEISSDYIKLESNDFTIDLDRNNGLVTILLNKEIHTLSCTKSVFTM